MRDQHSRAVEHALSTCVANVQLLGRYSIEKLFIFYRYHTEASLVDVFLEILWAPAPLLLVIWALEAIPLGDPNAGLDANVLTIFRSAISHGILIAALLVSIKRSLRIPDAQYSLLRIACIAAIGGITLELVWLPIAIVWGFPVPFREFIGVLPFSVLVGALNVLLARDMLVAQAAKLKILLPLLGAQLSLFYAFLGLSILFAQVPVGGQIAMIATLQIIKIITKNLLWRLTRRLDDISTDVTICIVEMSGSLYQTVCLQYANTIHLELVIMALDFLQALYEVHTHMGYMYTTDNRQTLQTAVKIVASALHPGSPERPRAVKRQSSASSLNKIGHRSSLLPMLARSSRQSSQYMIGTERESSGMPESLLAFGDHVIAGSVDLADCSSEEHPNNVVPADETQELSTLPSGRSEPAYTLQLKSSFKLARRSSWTPRLPGKSRRALVVAENQNVVAAAGGTTARITPMDANSPGILQAMETFEPPDLGHGRQIKPRRQPTYSRPPPASPKRTIKVPLHSSRASVYAVAADSGPPSMAPTDPMTASFADSASNEASSGLPTLSFNARDSDEHEPGAPIVQPTVVDGLIIRRRDQAHILQQSLQLLFACEVLVFVEFMEMFVPLVYGTYVGVAWHLPNARYSLVLRSMSRANMYTTVITSFISVGLELISFLWLSWLMHRRYGISPLRQLAFVLRHYRGAFHGKLIGCFITIVLSATVHQGMEFLH